MKLAKFEWNGERLWGKLPVIVVAFLLLAGAIGCEPPKYYKCEGVVMHDGEPVPYLQITFAPDIVDSVRMPIAISDVEGRFQMASGRHEGVPPGSYTVYVEDPGEPDGRRTSLEPSYLYVIDRYSPEKSDYKYVADRHRTDFILRLDTREPVEESEVSGEVN
jgi:hypothetical protein